MAESRTNDPVGSRSIGETAILYTGNYLNKLDGERIRRECCWRLEMGCCALVINFRDTELVNSIGVSLLWGIVEAAEGAGAQLVFSDVKDQTVQLFEMLGLTRHVALAADEQEALRMLTESTASLSTAGH